MSGSDAGRVEVVLSGDLTIRTIGDAYEQISAALSARDEVVLSLGEVADADLTFIQLIESARRSARERGVRLALEAPAEGVLRAMLERGGFLGAGDADRAAFWLQGAA